MDQGTAVCWFHLCQKCSSFAGHFHGHVGAPVQCGTLPNGAGSRLHSKPLNTAIGCLFGPCCSNGPQPQGSSILWQHIKFWHLESLLSKQQPNRTIWTLYLFHQSSTLRKKVTRHNWKGRGNLHFTLSNATRGQKLKHILFQQLYPYGRRYAPKFLTNLVLA